MFVNALISVSSDRKLAHRLDWFCYFLFLRKLNENNLKWDRINFILSVSKLFKYSLSFLFLTFQFSELDYEWNYNFYFGHFSDVLFKNTWCNSFNEKEYESTQTFWHLSALCFCKTLSMYSLNFFVCHVVSSYTRF